MTNKLLHVVTLGCILTSVLPLTACGAPTHAAATEPTSASATTARYYDTNATFKSKKLTTWLIPLQKNAYSSRSWTQLVPAQITKNGRITIAKTQYQLPVSPDQSVQYLIEGHTIYWSLIGALSNRLFFSTWKSSSTSQGSAVESTGLLYTSSSEGNQPAPSIQLFQGANSVFFTLRTNGKMNKDLYQVSNNHDIKQLLATNWSNSRPLYTLSNDTTNLFVSFSNHFPNDPILIDTHKGSVIQNLQLPYWPLEAVVLNQQFYLVSGSSTYFINTEKKLQIASWIPPEMDQVAQSIAKSFHATYLELPSLYFKNQIKKPYQVTVNLQNSSSYSLSLNPKSGTNNVHMDVTEVSQSTTITSYANWISTLNTLISNANGKSIVVNTMTHSLQSTSSFFGSLPVIHQFILKSFNGPWLRWTQTNSKKGNRNWYVAWGAHNWLYSIGPLAGPTDPVSQHLLNQFILRSKQTPLQPIAETGKVSIKLAWNQNTAYPQQSLYEYLPAPGLSVQLTVPGFSGWHDLANFSVVDNPSVKT